MGLHEQPHTQDDSVLVCYARAHEGRWEALCLDFDLAVQGSSLPEVKDRLEEAIADYVAAAARESEPGRSRLLGRRAPFFTRLGWALRFFKGTMLGKNRNADSTVGFPVTCHA